MSIYATDQRRRFLVPEVIQTSSMDCGPAALAALLNGSGMAISYPRLREACSTDVDGTSIDSLEGLCAELGVDAQQTMLPSDHLLLRASATLPAIAVMELANGLTHFVVVWRKLGNFVQVMDPARGRLWIRRQVFLDSLYQHRQLVGTDDWRAYAGGAEFQALLRESLQSAGIPEADAAAFISRALEDPGWQSLGRLDAIARLLRRLPGSRYSASQRCSQVAALLATPALIPDSCFQVRPVENDSGSLYLHGTVLLCVPVASGQRFTSTFEDESPQPSNSAQRLDRTRGRLRVPVLNELIELLRQAKLTGQMSWLAVAGLGIGIATFFEALAYRYLIGLRPPTDLTGLGLLALVVVVPLLVTALIEVGGMRLALQLGRQLDVRLRAALLAKLPAVADKYFSSRLISDLAERGHALSELRDFPETGRRILGTGCRIAFILLGLWWLVPDQAMYLLLMGLIALFAPMALQWFIAERDLRMRTHLGGLSRFYLDALQASEPIWAHGAEPAMANEHEQMLVRWYGACVALQRPLVWFEMLQAVGLVLLAVAVVHSLWIAGASLGTLLLAAYWALFIPMLSRQWLQLLRQVPRMRNVAGRVFELLDAEEELLRSPSEVFQSTASTPDTHKGQGGVALTFTDVGVQIGEGVLLASCELTIRAGEKIAIVGRSGSGKSSFLSVILGWLRPSTGSLWIDGNLADPDRIAALRERSISVDPSLYIWNRTLYDNLLYGLQRPQSADPGAALQQSAFTDDLPRMSEGLATLAGENASRLSGGEGQRLRLARALIRDEVSLVLLDEPFTGMDEGQRRRLHAAVDERWPEATRLFVSHHLRETLDYPRVLVFDAGQIVEDGAPAVLSADPSSRYAQLLAGEHRLRSDLSKSARWRRAQMADGQLEFS